MDIVKRYVKENRQKYNSIHNPQLWKKISELLNEKGPAKKDPNTWKNVCLAVYLLLKLSYVS